MKSNKITDMSNGPSRPVVDDSKRPSDFRVVLLGGKWTKEKKGVVADCLKAEARAGTVAAAWALQYWRQRSSSYFISKFGESGAQVCAAAWCSVMEYYFELWSGQPNKHYVYQQADFDGAPELPELREWLPRLNSAARPRAEELLRMRPA